MNKISFFLIHLFVNENNFLKSYTITNGFINVHHGIASNRLDQPSFVSFLVPTDPYTHQNYDVWPTSFDL